MGVAACGIAMAAQAWAAHPAVDAAVGKLKDPEVAVRIAAARELAGLGAKCAPRLGDIVPAPLDGRLPKSRLLVSVVRRVTPRGESVRFDTLARWGQRGMPLA